MAHLTVVAALAAMVTLPASMASPALSPAPKESGSLSTLSGVVDHGPKSATQAFGAWRGSRVTTVTDFLGGDTWASMADATWTRGRWAGHPDPLHFVWSMFMEPRQERGSLAEVISGRRDYVFRSAGLELVANGYAASTIRIGWEFSGTWYNYGRTHETPAAYVAAFRRIVTVLRKISGQRFTFDWCAGDASVDPRSWWPGDAYVDVVSLDVYDGPNYLSHPAKFGLDFMAWFAAVHKKRVGIPEWGLRGYCGTKAKRWPTSDDPPFIKAMRGWIVQHRPAYESYFDEDDNPCQRSRIFSTDPEYKVTFPKAAAAYRVAW